MSNINENNTINHINNDNTSTNNWNQNIYQMIDKYFENISTMSDVNRNSAYNNVCSLITHNHLKGRLDINDKLKDYCNKLNIHL